MGRTGKNKTDNLLAEKYPDNNIELEYKIANIKRKSFFEFLPEGGMPKNPAGDFKIPIGLLAFEEKKCLSIRCDVKFILGSGKSEQELFGALVDYTFLLKTMDGLKTSDKSISIPKEFLLTLLGMTLSGARAILAISLSNEIYKKILLPPVYPNSYFDSAEDFVEVPFIRSGKKE